MSSAKRSGSCATDQDKLYRQIYVVDLKLKPGFDLLVMRAVVIYSDNFLRLPPYKCYCSSSKEVPETLEDLSAYAFRVWDFQTMEMMGKTSTDYSLKRTPEQD